MIKLGFESYCQNCSELIPIVKRDTIRDCRGNEVNNSYIICQHSELCATVAENIRKELESGRPDETNR